MLYAGAVNGGRRRGGGENATSTAALDVRFAYIINWQRTYDTKEMMSVSAVVTLASKVREWRK